LRGGECGISVINQGEEEPEESCLSNAGRAEKRSAWNSRKHRKRGKKINEKLINM
jgi:hypothetical protein